MGLQGRNVTEGPTPFPEVITFDQSSDCELTSDGEPKKPRKGSLTTREKQLITYLVIAIAVGVITVLIVVWHYSVLLHLTSRELNCTTINLSPGFKHGNKTENQETLSTTTEYYRKGLKLENKMESEERLSTTTEYYESGTTQEKETVNEERLCTTTDCYRSAAILMQSMDHTADPCEDFFQYACGSWAAAHPIPDTQIHNNWYQEIDMRVRRKIRDFLEEDWNYGESRVAKQAKLMYRQCIDTDYLNSVGVEPIYDILESVGLFREPLFNSSDYYEEYAYDIGEVDWVSIIVQAKKQMALDLLIGFTVEPSYQDNRTYRMVLYAPTNSTPMPWLHQEESSIFEEPDYYKYFQTAMSILLPDQYINSKYSARLYNIDTKLFSLATNVGFSDEEMTLDQLQQLTDNSLGIENFINWTQYMEEMFEDALPWEMIKDQKIIVRDQIYFKKLFSYLSQLPTYELEHILWWRVAKVLFPHSTSQLKNLKDRFMEMRDQRKASDSRTMYCTNVVKSLMDMATAFFIKDPDFSDLRTKVKDMMRDIQRVFKDKMRSTWLPADLKQEFLVKAQAVRMAIGYPEWLRTEEDLESYYSNINLDGNDFLHNIVVLLGHTTNQTLNLLATDNTRESWNSRMDATDVNAYYHRQSNGLYIPSGMINFPKIGWGLEAMNYAGIGFTLGHELSHGFDNYGRLYDRIGNQSVNWNWRSESVYKISTDCFVDKYSRYSQYGQDVDGRWTLEENLADDGGVRLSYQAYQRFLERNGPEPKLPGFQHLSHEQLFFLYYANSWCEAPTKVYYSQPYVKYDSHAPQRFRVLGTLSNNRDFIRAWNCSAGSFMNPRKKCTVW